MTGAFRVGEALVGQNFVYFPECNGMGCTVLSGPFFGSGFCPRAAAWFPPQLVYVVAWADGSESYEAPRNLRRKQPPTGLVSVLRMFDLTALAPREVEAA